MLANSYVGARTVWAFFFTLAMSRVASATVDAEEPRLSTPEPMQEETARTPFIPTPLPSQAEEPTLRRTAAIYGIWGPGSPVGIIGVEGVQRFGSHFEIATGFGFGAAAAGSEPHAGLGHAFQWALMPRLRFGDDTRAFTMGAGMSGGQYGGGWLSSCVEDPCATTYPTHYVIWSNVEIGYEHWWSSGFAMRFFAGYGHGFANGDSFNLPYFGLGVGYAF